MASDVAVLALGAAVGAAAWVRADTRAARPLLIALVAALALNVGAAVSGAYLDGRAPYRGSALAWYALHAGSHLAWPALAAAFSWRVTRESWPRAPFLAWGLSLAALIVFHDRLYGMPALCVLAAGWGLSVAYGVAGILLSAHYRRSSFLAAAIVGPEAFALAAVLREDGALADRFAAAWPAVQSIRTVEFLAIVGVCIWVRMSRATR